MMALTEDSEQTLIGKQFERSLTSQQPPKEFYIAAHLRSLAGELSCTLAKIYLDSASLQRVGSTHPKHSLGVLYKFNVLKA